MKNNKILFGITLASTLIVGCGSNPIISTPVENIDNFHLKVSELTEAEAKNWGHLDLVKDTIPGMSVDKAYSEIIKGKKGTKVIVAVIDSGIDIDHEDLDGVIWTNKDEIPNNGKDDDNNGYIDDIHGWNFLGETYKEQLELTRIIANGNSNTPDYAKAKAAYDKELKTWQERKAQNDQILPVINNSHSAISKHLGKEDYTLEDVTAIKSVDQNLLRHQSIISQTFGFGIGTIKETIAVFDEQKQQIDDQLNYNLNIAFKGRKTGDNPDDLNDKVGYGNGNVKPKEASESHGTHVSGIIAAERNNGLGANGVANNVEIMAIRSTPRGDEYDKDVALAIRYAVDNGAKVINASFGKSFSPHSDWVRDALKYASDNDVVFVHAAGNDSKNVDVESNFPSDHVNGNEISKTYISVGALSSKYGSSMVASFSNYGIKNVDIFAPGEAIYSTVPENEYQENSGTSMAAPGVAGIVALIRSQYPKLSAEKVKQVILQSGTPLKNKVIVGGEASDIQAFSQLSKTGKIANAYNALIIASKL
ncbi:S8 family peptidase [Winogradskyella immobilis]|uniref:S8 family peptidase n=1 Tax=Winogradskyella immobilis TaxID=2816852 RepID=A0ABS8EMA7_9FLAO|nr:S8 family peptidase [Winogradskyella immobilis]MCC1483432.1 S8 family peptidase [Winogradskyella immobilis]MCG0015526.1 S8 family peptidase [Winogradskyella immobilis]